LLGLVDQRGVGLIPYSDVFLFQIYNNQWEYTTREKQKYNPSHLLKFKFIPHEFSTEPYPTRYRVISPSYKKLCPDLTTGAQTYN